MSTWTSKLVSAILLTGLAACQPVAGLPKLSGLNLLVSSKTSVDVLDGAVTITGPKGYCPDPDTVHNADDSAVVLLGRCFSDSKVAPALLSVTVGQSGTAQDAIATELAEFFASSAGRATLSPRGRAKDIKILSALSSKGIFLIQVRDRNELPYWRAMTGMAGRMVSVRANGPDLSPEDGRKLVEATVGALKRANGKS